MPSVPPDRRGAAEYRRSSHRASAPSAIGGGVEPGPRGGGERGLPAPPAAGGAGAGRAQRRPHHHGDDSRDDDGGQASTPRRRHRCVPGGYSSRGARAGQPAGRHEQLSEVTGRPGSRPRHRSRPAGPPRPGTPASAGRGLPRAPTAVRFPRSPLAGQQPRRQGGRRCGEQQQLQRADEQQRPRHHQAAGQCGQDVRQAGGDLQAAEALSAPQRGDQGAQPVPEGADAAGRGCGRCPR